MFLPRPKKAIEEMSPSTLGVPVLTHYSEGTPFNPPILTTVEVAL